MQAEALHDRDVAVKLANISNAGFAVAVLGTGIGLMSLLLSGSSPHSGGTTLNVEASPQVAWFGCKGLFWGQKDAVSLALMPAIAAFSGSSRAAVTAEVDAAKRPLW